MAIDFSATDIFNKEQQFSRIEWGAEAPVLEVELNELQKIQNYKRNISSQKLVGDIDGFFTAGTMTYSSGTLTVPADTIIANGEVLEILGAMTLSGLVNGDTVKLHVFETEVTKDTSLVKSGNLSGGTSITNGIQDSRIGMETSRRIQKQVQLVKTAIPDPIPAGEAYMTVATIGTGNNFIDTRVKVPTTAGLNTLLDNHKVDYTLQVPYGGTTTNISNAYSIVNPPIDSLVAGMAICIKVNANSSGPTTLNWNGKGAASILKSNGFAVSNLKADGIYTLRYDGTNFILQGEGGSGTAIASDLLSGKTATVDAGDITGTMPNRGTVNITPSTTNQTILSGYHSGLGVVYGDSDLISANIKAGANIFGVSGNTNVVDTSQGDAVASDIISGKKAYVDGSLVTGTLDIFGSSPVNAVVETGYSISAGDKVTLAGNKARKYYSKLPLKLNSDGVILPSNGDWGFSVGAACGLTDSLSLFFYVKHGSSSDLLTGLAITHVGKSGITRGTPSSSGSARVSDAPWKAIRLSNTSALLLFMADSSPYYLKAVVATVSGTAVSFGGSLKIDSTSPLHWVDAVLFDTNKVLIAYDQKVVVATISGTNISLGTAVAVPSAVPGMGVSAISSSTVVLTYPTTTELRALIISITGTGITLNSSALINNYGGPCAVKYIDTDLCVVCGEYVTAFTVSGTSIGTVGTPVIARKSIGSNTRSTFWSLDANTFAIKFSEVYGIGFKIYHLSGTTITADNFEIKTSASRNYFHIEETGIGLHVTGIDLDPSQEESHSLKLLIASANPDGIALTGGSGGQTISVYPFA